MKTLPTPTWFTLPALDEPATLLREAEVLDQLPALEGWARPATPPAAVVATVLTREPAR